MSSSRRCNYSVVYTTRVQASLQLKVEQSFEQTMAEVPICEVPVLEKERGNLFTGYRSKRDGYGFFLTGTEKKFARLQKQMTQIRRCDSVENPCQPRTNVINECGIAMKLVMLDTRISEQREAIATRLAHGIYDDASLLYLRLRIVPIRWLPQLGDDEQVAILARFRIGKIRRVRGITIHGCLNTRPMTIRYNRV